MTGRNDGGHAENPGRRRDWGWPVRRARFTARFDRENLPVLPAMHPRMANEQYGPTVVRQVEPPGYFALHYGVRTPVSVLVAHAVFGAILGGFCSFSTP